MEKAADGGRRMGERRAFSIERHMRRTDGMASAMTAAGLAEAGELGALMADIRALRAEMRALRERLDAVEGMAGTPQQGESPLSSPSEEHHAAHHHQHDEETQLLRVEVARMVRSLAAAKREIAEIKHPLADPDDDRMVRAASELDAIVSATERATNTIIDAAEAINGHCDSMLRDMGGSDVLSPRVEEIITLAASIFEACNFQDITGQRISKVVKTLEFIEDRIRAIVEDWGREAFMDLPLPQDNVDADDESALLNGPQLETHALSQDDIDSLFD